VQFGAVAGKPIQLAVATTPQVLGAFAGWGAGIEVALSGISGEDLEPGPVFPRLRQGIEFIARDDDDGELRSTGNDEAGLLIGVRSGSMSSATESSPR
jgi:hypothetical protein